MLHIFHDYLLSMTYEELIYTCRICGKEKRKPCHPVLGWARPVKVPKFLNITNEIIDEAIKEVRIEEKLRGDKP